MSTTSLLPSVDPTGRLRGWVFWCVACSVCHEIITDPALGAPCWILEGDAQIPTVRTPIVTQHEGRTCVCTLLEGWLCYETTSTHALAGLAIPLAIPSWLSIDRSAPADPVLLLHAAHASVPPHPFSPVPPKDTRHE